ncbi:MAG: mannosyl-3-phosphoglycerate phosphatase family protein, partial [bacterium]
DEILSILKKIRLDHNFSFQGFSDWSSEELSDITNLPLEKAKKAKARICSEPILWDDSEESFSKFKEIIQGHNLGLIQGGRFIHVTGQTNKGKGVLWLKQQYQNYNPEDNLTTIGLGDCPNDIAMLEVVDMPVVIDSVKREPLKLGSSYPNTIYTNRQGSVGWQYAMKKIFDL